jgi:hypothetical protein
MANDQTSRPALNLLWPWIMPPLLTRYVPFLGRFQSFSFTPDFRFASSYAILILSSTLTLSLSQIPFGTVSSAAIAPVPTQPPSSSPAKIDRLPGQSAADFDVKPDNVPEDLWRIAVIVVDAMCTVKGRASSIAVTVDRDTDAEEMRCSIVGDINSRATLKPLEEAALEGLSEQQKRSVVLNGACNEVPYTYWCLLEPLFKRTYRVPQLPQEYRCN